MGGLASPTITSRGAQIRLSLAAARAAAPSAGKTKLAPGLDKSLPTAGLA
jgi:hypothetical protein